MFLPLPLVFDGDDAYIQGTWTKVGIQSIYYGKPMNEIQKMTNAEVRKLVL